MIELYKNTYAGASLSELTAMMLEGADIGYPVTQISTADKTNLLTSDNYEAGISGWRIAPNGDVEFNTGTFRGELIAGQIHIPNKTTANSFHTNSTGNSWWGCSVADFTADNNNAKAYILNTGVGRFTDVLISGLRSGSDVNGTYLTDATVVNAKRTTAYGVNFIKNKYSDFEQYANGDTIGTGQSATCTADTTSGNYYFGTKGLKIVTSAVYGACYLSASLTTYDIPIKPLTKYIISYYAKGNVGGESVRTGIRVNGNNYVGYVNQTVTTTWTRYSNVITTVAGNTSCLVTIGSPNSGTTFWVDGVMFEEANATATSPEPSAWRPGAFTELYADNIIANNLSAISADLGTITAGNMTLDASGFIKTTGATGYNNGNGIWLGYDTDAYKMSIVNGNNKFLANGTKLELTGDAGAANMIVAGGIIQGAFTITDFGVAGGNVPVIYQVFSGHITANNDYLWALTSVGTAPQDGRGVRWNRTKANAIFRDIADVDISGGGTQIYDGGCTDGTNVYAILNGARTWQRYAKDYTSSTAVSTDTDTATTTHDACTYDGTYFCSLTSNTNLERGTISAGGSPSYTYVDTITLSNNVTGALVWNAANSCWYGFDSVNKLIRKFNAAGTQTATLAIQETVYGILVLENKLYMCIELVAPAASATTRWSLQCLPFDL